MKNKSDAHIERRIVTGLILKTEYLKRIEPLLKIKWLKSEESKRISNWCIKYFRKYEKAPKKEIQNIYLSKMESLDPDSAGLIEATLESLSKYQKKINVDFLFDETKDYLKRRQLELIIEKAVIELENNDLDEATQIISDYKPIQTVRSDGVVPLRSAKSIRETYEDQFTPLFSYGDTPFGKMINRTLCRGSFVSILAQSKHGKSFTLMDMGMRAISAGLNVAFFQGGDMSEKQQERRQGIWLTKRSDLPEYCNELYIPVLDCVYNQNGDCDLREKESKYNPFENYTPEQLRGEAESNNTTLKDLKERVSTTKNHKPCYNCLRGVNESKNKNFKGTIWYKKRKPVKPLIWKDVYHKVQKDFKHKLNKMRLITYPTEQLTMSMIRQEWDIMEKEGFHIDVCLIDYMDILAPDTDTKTLSIRDQENKKWARARALSIEKNALIIAPTQADAKSFSKKVLSKENFTEDKRKFDHVTSAFGINMTPMEKIKGIARYNSIVDRDVEGGQIVYTAHRLQVGRPILFSFY